MSSCDDERKAVALWMNAVGFQTRAADTSNTDETPGYIVACYPAPFTGEPTVGIRYYGKKGGKRSGARLAEEFTMLSMLREYLTLRFLLVFPVGMRANHHVLMLTPQQSGALSELSVLSQWSGVRLDIRATLDRITTDFKSSNDLTQLANNLRDLVRQLDEGV